MQEGIFAFLRSLRPDPRGMRPPRPPKVHKKTIFPRAVLWYNKSVRSARPGRRQRLDVIWYNNFIPHTGPASPAMGCPAGLF